MNADAQPPNAATMDPLDADLLVASVMAAIRVSGQDRPSNALLRMSSLGLLGVAGATVLVGGLLVLNPPRSGVGSAPSAPVGPIIVVADEPPFEWPFLEDSGWVEGDAAFLPGLPERYATLDRALAMLRDFMLAGLHAPRGDEGVTIIVPEGAEQATEVHLFVVLHGGANPAHVGAQFRVTARHDARGWWIDPRIQDRVFCDVPFGEVLPGVPSHVCD